METHLIALLQPSSVKNKPETGRTKFKNNVEYPKQAFPLSKVKATKLESAKVLTIAQAQTLISSLKDVVSSDSVKQLE